jgi:hypothetical protein
MYASFSYENTDILHFSNFHMLQFYDHISSRGGGAGWHPSHWLHRDAEVPPTRLSDPLEFGDRVASGIPGIRIQHGNYDI